MYRAVSRSLWSRADKSADSEELQSPEERRIHKIEVKYSYKGEKLQNFAEKRYNEIGMVGT